MKTLFARPVRTIAIALVIAALAAACGSNAADSHAGVGEASPSTIAPSSASSTPSPAERSAIDGEYTMSLTQHDVLAAGLRRSIAGELAGLWRVTFSLGYVQQFVNLGGANGITSDGYQGGFSVEGDRLTLTDQAPLMFTWHLTGKRLTLDLVNAASADPVDRFIWTAHPWERTVG
jgi:hypothetical protein